MTAVGLLLTATEVTQIFADCDSYAPKLMTKDVDATDSGHTVLNACQHAAQNASASFLRNYRHVRDDTKSAGGD